MSSQHNITLTLTKTIKKIAKCRVRTPNTNIYILKSHKGRLFAGHALGLGFFANQVEGKGHGSSTHCNEEVHFNGLEFRDLLLATQCLHPRSLLR